MRENASNKIVEVLVVMLAFVVVVIAFMDVFRLLVLVKRGITQYLPRE